MCELDFKKLVGNPAGQGDRQALKLVLVLSSAVLVIIIESKARVRAP